MLRILRRAIWLGPALSALDEYPNAVFVGNTVSDHFIWGLAAGPGHDIVDVASHRAITAVHVGSGHFLTQVVLAAAFWRLG